MQDTVSTQDELTARNGIYRLLGLLWREELSEALLVELRSPEVHAAFESVGLHLPRPESEVVSELAIDYCQLFVGPKGHLPPYQSVWQNGQLCGDATASMTRFIEVGRYEVTHLSNGQFVDHFGVQLDLMAHLLKQLASCKAAEKETIAEVIAAYANNHLRWPSQLLEQIVPKAKTEFYGSLATATQEFLKHDLASLPSHS